MKLITATNKCMALAIPIQYLFLVSTKPVSRNNAFTTASVKVDIGVVKNRPIRFQATHAKGIPAGKLNDSIDHRSFLVNAVKKQYNVKVTKGFAVLILTVADHITDDEVKPFVQWLNTIKVDKQIQQTTGKYLIAISD